MGHGKVGCHIGVYKIIVVVQAATKPDEEKKLRDLHSRRNFAVYY